MAVSVRGTESSYVADAVIRQLRSVFQKGSAMIETTAGVQWAEPGKKSQEQRSTETGAFKQYPHGCANRFQDDRPGTNSYKTPSAAPAACITTAFFFACDRVGFGAGGGGTQARAQVSPPRNGLVIDRVAFILKAVVPGIEAGRCPEPALTAKRECLLSEALTGVIGITLQATFDGGAK